MNLDANNSNIFNGLSGVPLLECALCKVYPDRVALVSSFGAESAVLLHMVASIDPGVPVIFLDTGKLFGETRRYVGELERLFGLHDLRIVRPEKAVEEIEDPSGVLWQQDPDRCCGFRKVLPLKRELDGFDAWITGRKRYQGEGRQSLDPVERFDGKTKINPLADWDRKQIEDYFHLHNLPRHPLQADGFQSIGCLPCTERAHPDGGPRDGRWAGLNKTECGIHLNQNQTNHGTKPNEQSRLP